MKKVDFSDSHWPLGLLGYAGEIEDLFPEEAMHIGIITILWNIHEANLSRLFCSILGAKSESFARAIIAKQPTHKAKRDLLALALQHTKLTKKRTNWLNAVLHETKRLADRRNSLIHGKYVVSFQNNDLYTEQNSPNSTRPKKPQRNSVKELKKVTQDLEALVQFTEGLCWEFSGRKVTRGINRLIAERKALKEKSS